MSAEQNQTEKPIVLLATQSRLSAKSIIKLLQAQFTVLEVEDAESAWQAMTDSDTVNLLIVDLALMQDQFGLLERIKTAQDKSIRQLASLLLVAENNDDIDRERALKNGASDFISMPFSSFELLARVRMHTQVFSHNEAAIDAATDGTIGVLQQLAPESFLESRLKQELSFSVRHKTPVSVCKVEVNHLAAIEQQHGHKIAQNVIKLFAKILQKTVRREDTVCHSGQGRFTILYPATNSLGALTAIKRISEAVTKAHINIANKKQIMTFSAAIYTALSDTEMTTDSIQHELERRLDEALIKGNGAIITAGFKDSASKCHSSVQRALMLIDAGKTDDIKDDSKNLMMQVIPLLRVADQQLDLGMEKVIESLVKRLERR